MNLYRLNKEEKYDLFRRMIEKRKKLGLPFREICDFYGIQRNGFHDIKRYIKTQADLGCPTAKELCVLVEDL